MTIKFPNGKSVAAVLLARDDAAMRVRVPSTGDLLEVTDIGRTWITPDCEPVTIEFEWQLRARKRASEGSHELAARLAHLILGGDTEPERNRPDRAVGMLNPTGSAPLVNSDRSCVMTT